MANDTYKTENDTSLEQSLTEDDIYQPDNDLSLSDNLVSVPQLGTSAAQAAATGGTSRLRTGLLLPTTAEATGEGATLSASGSSTLDTTAGIATSEGTTISIDAGVTPTIELTSAEATATGKTSNLQDTGFDTVTANASATGSTGLNLKIPPISTTEATANAGGGETQFAGVIGTGGEISVIIDGERIDTYTNIEVKKRLNELDTFKFTAFIEDDKDRQLIQEGADVKIVEGYDDLLFKGRLSEVEYKSTFRAECEGNGMGIKLLNRKTDRVTYKTNADDIVKSEVSEDIITYGDIEPAPVTNLRFDHDNLARAVAGAANAVGYDWYIDQKNDDKYEKDYLNFVKDAGSNSVQETYEIGNSARMVERNKDEGFVVNDITLLGRGDGINQLEARVFAATKRFTQLDGQISESETGSFTVDDTSVFGSTGDNIVVRVGKEVIDADITDGSTLSINRRGVDRFDGEPTEAMQHYDGLTVWLRENKTQGIGPFTPESKSTAEPGSSIAEKGVIEDRSTDKTIVDESTLEKVADRELRNRFEDVFQVQVKPTDPRTTRDLSLGDKVAVKDLTAMDVDDTFQLVGMDVKRNSSEEGTTLHLANRPRRLTERLSDIERDKDTLNAHMQGATNIAPLNFNDNADNDNPLQANLYVPEDAVAVNKVEVAAKRESFRGYVQNSKHDHGIAATASSDFGETNTSTVAGVSNFNMSTGGTVSTTLNAPDVTEFTGHVEPFVLVHSFSSSTGPANIKVTITNTSDGRTVLDTGSRGIVTDATDYFSNVDGDGIKNDKYELKVEILDDFGNSHDIGISGGLRTVAQHDHEIDDTTKDAGNPVYGIFEPSNEPDVDVDLVVDGDIVETFTNVSVGDEIDPEEVSKSLNDPIAGNYHDIKLVPKEAGGGNNGRCRLNTDVNAKIFIESTL